MKRHTLVTAQKCCVVFAAFAATLLSATARQPAISAAQSPDDINFGVISDLHFNPMRSSGAWQMFTNENWDAARAEAALQADKPNTSDRLGFDSSFCLIESALKSMADQPLAFVICTGDLMAHDREWANKINPAQQAEFVRRSFETLARAAHEQFPNSPFYPMLGNNDTDSHDQEPSLDYLKDFAATWSPCVPSGTFDAYFATTGYYEAQLPGLDHCRIAVFDSTAFGLKNHRDDGRAASVMDRLAKFMNASGPDERLIACHIPPGLDFATSLLRTGGADPSPSQRVEYWAEKWQRPFLQLLSSGNTNLIGAICGHTHRDEFRVVYSGGTPSAFVHITPGISPIYTNKPEYQVFTVNRHTGQIKDYRTYRLMNFKDLEQSNWSNFKPQWVMAYSFCDTYHATNYNAQTLDRVFNPRGRNVQSLETMNRTAFAVNFDTGAGFFAPLLIFKGKFYWETTVLSGQ